MLLTGVVAQAKKGRTEWAAVRRTALSLSQEALHQRIGVVLRCRIGRSAALRLVCDPDLPFDRLLSLWRVRKRSGRRHIGHRLRAQADRASGAARRVAMVFRCGERAGARFLRGVFGAPVRYGTRTLGMRGAPPRCAARRTQWSRDLSGCWARTSWAGQCWFPNSA